MPVQRSDFTEKQHNLALGSRSGWISPQRDKISANGEIYTLSKCIELHACEFIASESIGASSSAVTTVGFKFAEKQRNLALKRQESPPHEHRDKRGTTKDVGVRQKHGVLT